MNELYLLPFEMAVEDANVASVMCAYGQVNFTYNCESKPLLRQTLRKKWGFNGYVFSDRRAAQSTVPSILAGTDVEVDEAPEWYAPDVVKAALDKGEITVADIDDMLRERYIKMFQFGDFDDPETKFTWDRIAGELQPGRQPRPGRQGRGGGQPRAAAQQQRDPAAQGRAIESVALIGAKWFAGEATLPPRSGDRTQQHLGQRAVRGHPEAGPRNVLSKLGSDAKVTYNDGNNIDSAVALAKSVRRDHPDAR